ncbi:hypothetical protein MJO29_009384, partial [Puccinia striiformis f. sp. tritici]
ISIGVYPTTAEEVHPAQTEDKLEQLLQSLLEVGILTVQVMYKKVHEREITGQVEESPWDSQKSELNANIASGMSIPLEVITQVDQGTNPDRWLESFVEGAAHGNMYTNGIIFNVNQYRSLLQSKLADYFPDLHKQLNNNADETTPSDEKTIRKLNQPNP